MKKIRLSVVMATYQGEDFIEDQIESLLKYLGPDDEIIASDDGSQDATVAIMNRISDQRLKVIQSSYNIGYQNNFSRAINASQGKFVMFSDQDDICLPARMEISLTALEGSGMVCGDAVIVDKDLRVISSSFFKKRNSSFGVFHLFLRPSVIGSTMAFQRDFLMSHMPFPENIPHDHWLSIQAARTGNLTVIREPFILYRRHERSVSFTAMQKRRSLTKIISERMRLIRALIR